MNIALDIDGVVVDFIGSFIKTINQHFSTDLKHEDIYCHSIAQILGMPDIQVNQLILETFYNEEFNPISGAQDGINYLSKSNNIFLITARPKHLEDITKAFISKYQLAYEKLYFTNYLEKYKLDIEFDVFVEDSIEEAVTLSNNKGGLVLLFDQPWNRQTLNIKSLFKRVYNWKDIIKEVENFNALLTCNTY